MCNPIMSRAHEWAQMLPLTEHKVVCLRCGVKTKIGQWGEKYIPRCRIHWEFADSGWLEDVIPTLPQRKSQIWEFI
jgi:hypothetical protein